MRDQILLVNDLPGYGKVALSAMFPVLSHLGFRLYNLPTALVSNTLDYGRFDILDTTGYMKNTLEVWEELGFSFDAVCTGFIVSKEQAELVADYCAKERRKGTKIFVDPIMGDNGRLYNGVSEENVENMRRLCAVSDVMVPNFTEAAFLTGRCQGRDEVARDEAEQVLEGLRSLSGRSVVMTSVHADGESAVLGYDADHKRVFWLPFQEVPVRFPGTGDIFSALLTGNVMRGLPLEDASRNAMDVVRELIVCNQENADKYKGIPIEKYLSVIDCQS